MDLYTKAILTVISIALSALAIENVGGRARAASGLTRVAICDIDAPDRCVGVTLPFPDSAGHLRVFAP
jgi:hypothetical protein